MTGNELQTQFWRNFEKFISFLGCLIVIKKKNLKK